VCGSPQPTIQRLAAMRAVSFSGLCLICALHVRIDDAKSAKAFGIGRHI
jgi:hypothetical protein